GTLYGGDGRTTFALPDLRSRTPIHMGDGFDLGVKTGSETVTLTAAEIPAHTHGVQAVATLANSPSPNNALFAEESADFPYNSFSAATATALRSGTVTNAGGSQAHDNMQPYTTISFCIALQGLFPSRN